MSKRAPAPQAAPVLSDADEDALVDALARLLIADHERRRAAARERKEKSHDEEEAMSR